MDFAQNVGQGYGEAWRGILFRQTYRQLDEIVLRVNKWFRAIFPGFKLLEGDYECRWPTGEVLFLRYMESPRDYWNYHGHEYPWIGWEELTNWPTLECYDLMKSCSRSSDMRVPRKYRANTNPWGIGHNAVKARFVDPAPAGVVMVDERGLERVRVHGHWSENLRLMAAEPDYPAKIAAAAGSPEKARAWLDGDWDIVAGGMFDDLWKRSVHVLAPFAIPSSWRIDRAFDWGSSKPFSVGWYAESDGAPAILRDGSTVHYPPGSLFVIAEWYGWNGQANEGMKMAASDIAKGILATEREHALLKGRYVHDGPADSSIGDADQGVSIRDQMAQSGVTWIMADKGPGSRKNGWERIRELFHAAAQHPREAEGLWVFDHCVHFIRTVPTLPRDEKKPDDVDTKAEDHWGDQLRYRCMQPRQSFTFGGVRG